MDKWFGKEARDKVTGFTGIITGKTEWMYGCNQYCLMPTVDKDGKFREGQWFDEGRVEVLNNGINPCNVQAERNGADWANMPKPR